MSHLVESKLGVVFDQCRDTLRQLWLAFAAEKQAPWQVLRSSYPMLSDAELQRLAELKADIERHQRFKSYLSCKCQCDQQELINLNLFLEDGHTRAEWDELAKGVRHQADFAFTHCQKVDKN